MLTIGQTCSVTYIPSCANCQWNKSTTTKVPGHLHPLPVPDEHGQSIMVDFIRPLKEDLGFNCILSTTDCLGADIRMIPIHTDISAKNLAILFFNHWYCENSLPLDIISDCNKLFIEMSRGMGNPWGSGVRVDKGKGEGMDIQTPDPSRHP